MISSEYKCVFIHISRTGGTSIEQAFDYHGNNTERMMTAHEVKESFTEWGSHFKFSFIRNPWDRALSTYLHEFQNLSKTTLSFEDWIEEKSSRTCRAYWNQSEWITDMDFIGRHETIDQDFSRICKIIGADLKLEHYINNRTNHSHSSEYYNGNTRDMVAKWFAKDIEEFSYKFEGKKIFI